MTADGHAFVCRGTYRKLKKEKGQFNIPAVAAECLSSLLNGGARETRAQTHKDTNLKRVETFLFAMINHDGQGVTIINHYISTIISYN